MKKSRISCKTVQIKDLSADRNYSAGEYEKNMELKKLVNKKISESIEKILGDF